MSLDAAFRCSRVLSSLTVTVNAGTTVVRNLMNLHPSVSALYHLDILENEGASFIHFLLSAVFVRGLVAGLWANCKATIDVYDLTRYD